jgi:PhnB protein
MYAVNPYLNFQGNTEEAFNYYKKVFGGEFMTIVRFSEMGEAERLKLSADDATKIMHIALPIGKGTILMGTDALESMGQKVSFGNNQYLCINTATREEADRLFNELSADGKVEMAMADMPWGDYFGSFWDKFGLGWMISFNAEHIPQ